MKLLFALLLCIALGSCTIARVEYIGHSHPMTSLVDVFYDEKKINRDYEIMGQAVGSGLQIEHVEKELIQRAKLEGADGILISKLGKFSTGDGSSSHEINASFIKY